MTRGTETSCSLTAHVLRKGSGGRRNHHHAALINCHGATQMGGYYLLCTSFRRKNEIAQVPTSPLLLFSSTKNHERRAPPSLSIVCRLSIVHHHHRYPCSRVSTMAWATSPLATFQALIRSSSGLSPIMPLLAEVYPGTRLYAFVNPITRMKCAR